MAVQNVRWENFGPEPAHDYTFSVEKLINLNNQ
jgi:hypothetical protein